GVQCPRRRSAGPAQSEPDRDRHQRRPRPGQCRRPLRRLSGHPLPLGRDDDDADRGHRLPARGHRVPYAHQEPAVTLLPDPAWPVVILAVVVFGDGLLLIAPAISVLCAIIGLYSSYYLDTASGGMVVLAPGAVFLLVYLFGPRHGLIGRGVAARQRSRRVTADRTG